jgi:outer membrane protein OmpA-like peptidoglycan-associated protein
MRIRRTLGRASARPFPLARGASLAAALLAAPAWAQAPAGDTPPGLLPDAAPAPSQRAADPQQRSAAREGALGVDEVLSADPGPEGTFRLRLSLFHAEADDFPVKGNPDAFSGGQVAVAWTPLPFLEAYLAARNTSNTNRGSFPELLQTQGDLDLGLKGGYFVTDVVGLGASVQTHLTSGLGSSSVGDSAASFHFRGLATFDLHRTDRAPFRFHLNVGYYLENSSSVSDGTPGGTDLIQEWGLQVAEYDRVTFGAAFEAPFSAYISPYFEYRLDAPLHVKVVRGAIESHELTFGAFPHAITPGVRVFPMPSLAIDAAVRVGLASDPYPGVPATPPWMLLLGVSYTLDPRPQVIEKPVAQAAPPPPPPVVDGDVKGRILDAKTGEPVRGARVEYVVGGFNPQIADDAGRFTSYRLPPGKASLRVVADGYAARPVEVAVEAGKDAALDVKLDPEVKASGRLSVSVVDPKGKAHAAKVTVGGDAQRSGDFVKDHPFELDLPAGRYPLTVDAQGFSADPQQIEVKAGETTALRVSLRKGGKRAPLLVADEAPAAKHGGASIDGDRIRTRKPLRFGDDDKTLGKDAKAILDDVAALLKAHPEITKVRIEAHTAGGPDHDALVRVSEEQARSVQSQLVSRGVAAARLAVKGRGPDQPLAPNLTDRGRQKNRRVEFWIEERK